MEEQLLRNSAMPRNLKLFIGGLSFETSDDTLRNYFRQWGMVTDAVVMKDGVSRRSRGFGFITYADPHSVEYALAQPEHIIDGRRVEAKRAVPRTDMVLASAQAAAANTQDLYGVPHDADRLDMTTLRNRAPSNASCSSGGGGGGAGGGGALPQDGAAHGGTKVFVGGLHYETRDNAFRTYFEQFGKVLAADVMFNRETHKSRGFGFVVFESADSAARVLQTSHHTINGKVVEVKRAVPRMMQAPAAMPQAPSAAAQQHGSSFMSPITTPLRHRGSVSGGGGGDGGKDSALQGMIAQQLHQQHMQNVARFAAVAAAAAADSYAAALRYGPAPSGGYASQNGDHEQPAQHQQHQQQQQRIAPPPQPLRMPSASPLFAPSTLYHGGAAVDPSYLLLPQAAAGTRTDGWGLSSGGGDGGSGSGVPPLDLDGQALDSYAMPPPGAPTPAGLKDVRYAFSHAGAGYAQQPPQRRASHGGAGGSGGARGIGFSPFQLPLDRNSNQPPSKEGADLSPFFGAQSGPDGQPLGGMRIGGGGGSGGAAASSMLEAAMADLQLGGAVPPRDTSLFSFAAGGGSAAGGGGGGYGAAGPDSDETFGRDDGASSVGSGAAAAANGGARSTNVLAPWSSDFFGRGFAADCGGGDEAGGVGAAAAGAGFEERANGCAGGGDACVGPDWGASRDWPAYHGNDEVAGEGRGGGARSVSPVVAAAVAVPPQPLQQQRSPAAGLCGQADAENQQLAGDGAGAAAARLGLLPSGQACGLPLSTAARFESSLF